MKTIKGKLILEDGQRPRNIQVQARQLVPSGFGTESKPLLGQNELIQVDTKGYFTINVPDDNVLGDFPTIELSIFERGDQFKTIPAEFSDQLQRFTVESLQQVFPSYSNLEKLVQPIIANQDVRPAQLGNESISVVAKELQLPERIIENFGKADSYVNSFGTHPEVAQSFLAIIDGYTPIDGSVGGGGGLPGLPEIPEDIGNFNKSGCLLNAGGGGIDPVAAFLHEQVSLPENISFEDVLGQIKTIRNEEIFSSINEPLVDGSSSLSELLRTSITHVDANADVDIIARNFLSQHADHLGTPEEMWDSFSSDNMLSEFVPSLRMAAAAGPLLHYDSNMIACVLKQMDTPDSPVNSYPDLTDLSEESWVTLMMAENVIPPAFIEGETEEVRRINYAKNIRQNLENQFPNRVVKQSFIDTEHIDEISSFFSAADELGYNFRTEPLDRFVKEQDINISQEGLNDLRQTQRMYNVSSSIDDAKMLMSKGFNSARSIAGTPFQSYQKILSDSLSDEEVIKSHARATEINTRTNLMYYGIRNYYKSIDIPALTQVNELITGLTRPEPPSPTDALDELGLPGFTYQDLLSNFSSCSCGHCKSVFSASAYLVDLMHYVLGGRYHSDDDPTNDIQGIAYEEFTRRRPDIKYLLLSCENANIELPYIDLINEILETYILYADQNNSIDIDDDFAQSHTYDTNGFPTELLKARPQYVQPIDGNPDPYALLKEAVYPISLPYDLNMQSSLRYMDKLEIDYSNLMDLFDLNEESYKIILGLSEGEQTLLTTNENIADLYDSSNTMDLRRLDILLEKLQINYDQLSRIINTQYVNPQGLIIITQIIDIPGGAPDLLTCDPEKLIINLQDDTIDLINIHKFVRLWRCTELEIEELALLLWRIGNKNGTNSSFEYSVDQLRELADYLSINQILNLPIAELVSLTGNIPLKGEDSLYHRLFLNKAVKENVAFTLNADQTELADTAILLTANNYALRAGLRIREEDIELLLTHLLLKDKTINQETISLLLRYTLFAKAKRISIKSLIGITELINLSDPFDSIEVIRDLSELIDHIQQSRFSVELLTNIYSQDLSNAISEDFVKTVQDQIAKSFENEYSLINQDFNSNNLYQLLSRLYEGEIIQDVVKETEEQKGYSSKLLNNFPFIDLPDLPSEVSEHPAFFFNTYKPYLKQKTLERIIYQVVSETIGLELESVIFLFENIFINESNDPSIESEIEINKLLDIYLDDSLTAEEKNIEEKNQLKKTLSLFQKSGELINRFLLSQKEVVSIHQLNTGDQVFSDVNFYALRDDVSERTKQFRGWQQLFAYTKLRNQLPNENRVSLIDIFNHDQKEFNDTTIKFNELLELIVETTKWELTNIKEVIDEAYSDINAIVPLDEKKLSIEQFQTLTDINHLSQKTGISPTVLQTWAKDNIDFSFARDVEQAVRAFAGESQWLAVTKNVNDILREERRDALSTYILNRQEFRDQDITTHEDLYAHMLIDTEMNSCMNTSRIVQANASIQLFVQRTLMNLESPVVRPQDIDAQAWEWMRKYRVWEANRKVFLYPENWIEPELRDNKTPFFKDLEGELLQNEVTESNIEKAIETYLRKLDEVAHLEVMAMYEQEFLAGIKLWIFARTFNSPRKYYYRYRSIYNEWVGWQALDLDVEGDILVAHEWNRRLYLFWLVITEKKEYDAAPGKTEDDVFTSPKMKQRAAGEPSTYYEVKLAWSEFRDGIWSQKQESDVIGEKKIITRKPTRLELVEYDDGLFIGCFGSTASVLPSILVGFYFNGCNKKPSIIRKPHNQSSFNSTAKINGELIQLVAKNGRRSTEGEFVPNQVALGINPIFSFGFKSDSITPINNIASKTIVHKNDKGDSLEFNYGDSLIIQSDNINYLLQTDVIGREVKVNNRERDFCSNPSSIGLGQPTRGLSDLINPGTTDINFGNNYQVGGVKFNAGDNLQFVGSESRFIFDICARVEMHWHPFTCQFIEDLNVFGVKGLYEIRKQVPEFSYPGAEKAFHESSILLPEPTLAETAFGHIHSPSSRHIKESFPLFELQYGFTEPYSIYNWELFFHIPLLIANRLSANQRFDEAQKWYHKVYDPTNSDRQYWQFLPFYKTPTQNLQELVSGLANSDTNSHLSSAIENWRKNPFEPHQIARIWPMAYMKNVLLKYLDNLIAWGDNLFRQFTRESVYESIQIYLLAKEILGDRPHNIPPLAEPESLAYDDLRKNLDDSTLSVPVEVQLETMISTKHTGTIADSISEDSTQLQNVFTTNYFCIPRNANLDNYYTIIEDRLFKIRNCQDIEGISRSLALFEPPIDPALLIKAEANGIDFGNILNDLYAPLPHYRFTFCLQKAQELIGEVKSFGGALLSALEKKDTEELSLLRSSHEIVMQELIRDVRKKQIEESEASEQALLYSELSAKARYVYYYKLLNAEDPKIDDDIEAEIPDIEIPSDPGEGNNPTNFALSSNEIHDLEKSAEAKDWQLVSSGFETASAVANFVPRFQAQPWGVGASFGGQDVGAALSAFGRFFGMLSYISSYEATRSSKVGGHFRRQQEWSQQGTLAAREINQIRKQRLAAQIRIEIANNELRNHDQQTKHSREIEDFLKRKFSNEDLYGWMKSQLSTLYFQMYQLAVDASKQAERCYRHERAIDSSNYIKTNNWDSLRKGLLAGERLSLACKQMEKAYLQHNKREFEITKNISLLQLNPEALVTLRRDSKCEFVIPEFYYDLDFPGHYMRRIKSVSISIPCVTGQYTEVNCKLSLLNSKIRMNTDLSSGYPEKVVNEETRFNILRGSIDSIATSSGQNDSGLFEFNFRDERYLPFEYSGAISDWRLELTNALPRFDYNSISDIIIHVRYCARDGGDTFASEATDYVKTAVNNWIQKFNIETETPEEDTFIPRVFSLRHEFPNEFNALKSEGAVEFNIDERYLPFFLRGKLEGLASAENNIEVLHAINLEVPSNFMNVTFEAQSKSFLVTLDGGSGVSLEDLRELKDVYFLIKLKVSE